MSQKLLEALGVIAIDAGRVAILVAPPPDLDLQFIYRAAQSVYWNPDGGRLEDRYTLEDSQVSSARRIAGALVGEYGLRLRASASMRWDGIGADAREAIEQEILW